MRQYFERVLKRSTTSLWVRNIQMGVSATALAYLGVACSDSETVRARGFFAGYCLWPGDHTNLSSNVKPPA